MLAVLRAVGWLGELGADWLHAGEASWLLACGWGLPAAAPKEVKLASSPQPMEVMCVHVSKNFACLQKFCESIPSMNFNLLSSLLPHRSFE